MMARDIYFDVRPLVTCGFCGGLTTERHGATGGVCGGCRIKNRRSNYSDPMIGANRRVTLVAHLIRQALQMARARRATEGANA